MLTIESKNKWKNIEKIRPFFQRFCLWNVAKIRLTVQTAIQYFPIYTAIQVLVFFNFFVIFLRFSKILFGV